MCWKRIADSNLNPYCEPQLGKRDLYRPTGGESISDEINARLWVPNFSDGEHSLLDIAERSGMPFSAISDAAHLLHENGLLAAVADPGANASEGSSQLALPKLGN